MILSSMRSLILMSLVVSMCPPRACFFALPSKFQSVLLSTHLLVSGALKLYLRELPVPLLGQNYDRWMTDCVQKDERRREAIDSILSALPQSQRHNLHYILKFLVSFNF